MKAIALLMLLVVSAYGQSQTSGKASTTGDCSPAISGNNNTTEMNCWFNKLPPDRTIPRDVYEKVVNKLRATKGVVTFDIVGDSRETYSFVAQLKNLFGAGGWAIGMDTMTGNLSAVIIGGPGGIRTTNGEGIMCGTSASPPSGSYNIAVDALKIAQIACTQVGASPDDVPANGIRLTVGARPSE
jgi:hypothetical protein